MKKEAAGVLAKHGLSVPLPSLSRSRPTCRVENDQDILEEGVRQVMAKTAYAQPVVIYRPLLAEVARRRCSQLRSSSAQRRPMTSTSHDRSEFLQPSLRVWLFVSLGDFL